ncbi:molybdopterin-containing oxidoreductase family protein [Terriglobus aquaticus]|uniref:Molybdopterin-dependent oxidoreductase n=1 Tax=Terriglobus aquaticus TaxID=940139 RepID=A0ABW9KMB4_9BACT|nr:molybdopterin-dependent oxidoreductase [Terriglobus aquaticus]
MNVPAAVSSGLAPVSPEYKADDNGASGSATASGFRLHHATCSLDCPDSCRVIATEDLATGRLVKLQGDPAHPVTRGFLCGKVARYLDHVYAPDRLLYPMRRRAGVPKGPLQHGREAESFERISWDEALSAICGRLQSVSDDHGPESILPYSYAGTIGQLGYGSMDRRFFHRLGASQLDRTICATAGAAALTDVYGTRLGMEPQSFAKAKLIIAWGANVHGNNIHLWPFIEQARRDGARLVVIDPYQTRTAKLADEHLRIRPGTDVLLAMSIMRVIVDESLYDSAYVESCTHGFAELRERLRAPAYAPEAAAAVTGIAAGQIVALAREYATAKPAAIRVNYGVQRSETGGTAMRAICMLPLLTGAWQHPGGGLLLSTSGAFGFNSARLHMPELMQASPLRRAARTVNMSQLGHALTQLGSEPAHDPPVHALFVYNSNPAAVAPNQNAVLRGMQRPDLFTVVHDSFFTDTADYADILLPAPTWLEQTDLQGAYGHLHVQISPAAIAPLGEARPNTWVFAQLAQRMGFPEPCFRDTDRDLMAQALDSGHPWFQGITVESLEAASGASSTGVTRARGNGFLALDVPRDAAGNFLPFADASWFRTPSGRGEFASESLRARGEDPLPAYYPGEEGFAATSPEYPLQLLPRKGDNWMNSTFANHPRHRAMQGEVAEGLEMHPADAAARGLHGGDEAEVRSARGSLRLRVYLSDRVPPGVVACTLGWNKLSPQGEGVNRLTSERVTDLGGGATFYSTLVQVERVPVQASATDGLPTLAFAAD